MANRPNIKQIRAASPGAVMLERLRKGKDEFRIVRWPGDDSADAVPFALVPLTCDELQEAYAAAYQRFEQLKLPITIYTADDLHSETNMQILLRAMVLLGDDGKPTTEQLFADGEELRKLLRTDVREALAGEYLELQSEVDPDPADMSPDLIEQIDELVKKKDAAALSATSSTTLAAFIIGTAGRSLS
ncbi:hypothetical protein LCGC14_0605550 [marine sediment metagenome]|uniref:Uncharacterized protein n=2 Tax=root TaxID=1 RepID=A0A9C9TJK7_9HYPH|nr:hypothetical protein [Aurantimonas coralicida]